MNMMWLTWREKKVHTCLSREEKNPCAYSAQGNRAMAMAMVKKRYAGWRGFRAILHGWFLWLKWGHVSVLLLHSITLVSLWWKSANACCCQKTNLPRCVGWSLLWLGQGEAGQGGGMRWWRPCRCWVCTGECTPAWGLCLEPGIVWENMCEKKRDHVNVQIIQWNACLREDEASNLEMCGRERERERERESSFL